jgi:hypothetical protein
MAPWSNYRYYCRAWGFQPAKKMVDIKVERGQYRGYYGLQKY